MGFLKASETSKGSSEGLSEGFQCVSKRFRMFQEVFRGFNGTFRQNGISRAREGLQGFQENIRDFSGLFQGVSKRFRWVSGGFRGFQRLSDAFMTASGRLQRGFKALQWSGLKAFKKVPGGSRVFWGLSIRLWE